MPLPLRTFLKFSLVSNQMLTLLMSQFSFCINASEVIQVILVFHVVFRPIPPYCYFHFHRHNVFVSSLTETTSNPSRDFEFELRTVICFHLKTTIILFHTRLVLFLFIFSSNLSILTVSEVFFLIDVLNVDIKCNIPIFLNLNNIINKTN